MSRKLWLVAVSSLVLVGMLWMGGITAIPADVAVAAPLDTSPKAAVEQLQPPITANGVYMWNYSVKFVCGRQGPFDTAGQQTPGEPLVKPGNYATEINIHNYTYREVPVRKKLLVLADTNQVMGREPKSVGPIARDAIVLKPDFATLDDCNRLWELTLGVGVVPPPSPPLMIGYLVILSPVDLDIDAVYTAEVPAGVGSATAPEQPTGISIDVERVGGKRVFVPTSYLADFQPVP